MIILTDLQRPLVLSLHRQPVIKYSKSPSGFDGSPTVLTKPQPLVTSKFVGRIGNVMFQYAMCLGFAARYNLTPVIPEKHPFRKIFQTKMMTMTESEFAITKFRQYAEAGGRAGVYDDGVNYLDKSTNIIFSGYFQVFRYFDEVKDTVREHFKFHPEIQEKELLFLLNSVPQFAGRKITVVGMHIRRGDMASTYNRNFGYTLADEAYLKRAMRYFRRRYKRIYFVVCSDDIPWSINALRSMHNVVFSIKSTPEVDLAILANCDHTILTVGTFGWWAAWLANADWIRK
eukprot:Filipodium_phascolosomae@DN2478_c0_g1_i1.p1